MILATPGAVRRHTKIHDNPEVKEVFEVDEDSESEEEDEQEEFVGVACSESGCDRMFKTEAAMKCHARVKHGGPPESLECPDCHKVFTQRAHLKVTLCLYPQTIRQEFKDKVAKRPYPLLNCILGVKGAAEK